MKKNKVVDVGGERFKAAKEVRREGGRVILAHGEVTGHAHAIASEDAVLFEAGDDAANVTLGTRILSTRKGAALSHEEHGTVDIPGGDWAVRIQRQYEAGAFRRVED